MLSENEKTPREILGNKIVKLIWEMHDIIEKHVPDDEALDLTFKIHEYAGHREYMTSHTDEEMQYDYLMETVYYPKCPVCYTNEQIESGEANKPLAELCPHTDCPRHGDPECWGWQNLTPPMTVDASLFREGRLPIQQEWSDFHYWLWCEKQPTPSFNDKEKEKAFYAKLEQEYRAKGLYP